MNTVPILYWPRKTNNDSEYQLARKLINSETGAMPQIMTDDLDLTLIFTKNPDAVLYFPVFCESTGWWGELLGADAKITNKIIISSSCQLMVIEKDEKPIAKGQSQLMAAEIYPTSGFFKKMNSSIATVSDMLATETGTVLALFSGKNKTQFVNVLESTGNSYLGCIGHY